MYAIFRNNRELCKESRKEGGVTNFVNYLTDKGFIVEVGKQRQYKKVEGEILVLSREENFDRENMIAWRENFEKLVYEPTF